jgi:hypothetical protein
VLVTGEAGIGKIRLVEELRAHAGGVTAEARGYPAEGPLAYGVATAWLRSGPVAARLTRLVRADLTELARLLPELAGQVTPPEPLPEAELRHRLPGAIGRALRAAGAPLLLIVDDAQRWPTRPPRSRTATPVTCSTRSRSGPTRPTTSG